MSRAFKTASFSRWARKCRLDDETLSQAVAEMKTMQITAAALLGMNDLAIRQAIELKQIEEIKHD